MSRALHTLIPITLAATLIGCVRPVATQPNIQPGPSPAQPASDGTALPHSQCLADECGIQRKVLITERGVRCRASQPDGDIAGEPLKFYWIYFIFEIVGSGDSAWYRIGETPSRDSIKGWVRGSVAERWPTRITAWPTTVVRFYANPGSLEEIVRTGWTAATPIAISNPPSGHKLISWPIVESRMIEHGGRSHEMLRVLFLGEHKGSTAVNPERMSASEVNTLRDGIRSLDLVFVVDNTMSTTEYVPQIIAALRKIAEALSHSSLKLKIRFSLVLYRDYGVPKLLFPDGGVVKVFPFTDNLQTFIDTISPLKAATVDSQEWEEAVADGLKAGLTQLPWRDSKLSERVLVLVGDSAGHAPNSPKNPNRITDDELIKQANEKGVRLFTLAIQSAHGGPQKRQMAQYEALAAGARGECHTLANAATIAERITTIFTTRATKIEQRDTYIEQRAAGATDAELIGSGLIDERQRCEIVEFLTDAKVDLNRLGPGSSNPGGIACGTGWCLAEQAGKPCIEKRVFVARWEVDLLLANLSDLLPRLSAPKDFVGVMEQSVGVREGRFLHRAPAEMLPNETMSVFLRKKHIPSSQGLLAFTEAELLSMSESRRASLRDQIRKTYIPELTRITRDDRLFFHLNDIEFAFVPDRLFP